MTASTNMGVALAQLEQRNDIHVSTLRKYVEALGGPAPMPGQGGAVAGADDG